MPSPPFRVHAPKPLRSSRIHAHTPFTAARPFLGRFQIRRFRLRGLIRSENGMVTSELAIGMFAVGFLLAGLAAVIASCVSYLELTENSHLVARSVALGSSEKEAEALVRELSPDAALTIHRHGELIEVELARGFSLSHISIPLTASSFAWQETP